MGHAILKAHRPRLDAIEIMINIDQIVLWIGCGQIIRWHYVLRVRCEEREPLIQLPLIEQITLFVQEVLDLLTVNGL